ncbi:MAG: hypothetical protein GX601_15000, partial [Anaerolineales bacterium]|nr:hypothetical protein [Anaerolineales bacterium]
MQARWGQQAVARFELYHDESKEAGYWHGILLVPEAEKARLVGLLCEARDAMAYRHPLSLKNVRENKKDVCGIAESWISIGVAALASRCRAGSDPVVYWIRGQEGSREIGVLDRPIGAKFILLRERDGLRTMSGALDHGARVETTFRMAAKGGLHYLGSEEEPIHITRMHFDGHEHYRRHLSRERIVGRLQGLRDYCSISEREDLIDDRRSDHRKECVCQAYDDCQLLQLTDLLVGCFRTLLGVATKPIHAQLAYPVRQLLDRYRAGWARMRNSRWRNAF